MNKVRIIFELIQVTINYEPAHLDFFKTKLHQSTINYACDQLHTLHPKKNHSHIKKKADQSFHLINVCSKDNITCLNSQEKGTLKENVLLEMLLYERLMKKMITFSRSHHLLLFGCKNEAFPADNIAIHVRLRRNRGM